MIWCLGASIDSSPSLVRASGRFLSVEETCRACVTSYGMMGDHRRHSYRLAGFFQDVQEKEGQSLQSHVFLGCYGVVEGNASGAWEIEDSHKDGAQACYR